MSFQLIRRLTPTVNAVNNYVGRAEEKLAHASASFSFDFRGKTVLDIGSSTGGFTELALTRGAKKVIAVEKGSHQMKAPLRFDPRIELHEKTDIFDFTLEMGDDWRGTPKMFAKQNFGGGSRQDPFPDVIVADVSFLSLTKILKYAKIHLSRSNTDFLVMLKPQFEARPDQLKNGVVKNETIRRDIIKHFEFWLKTNGFIIINKHDNELHGKTGNIERFYWLRKAGK